MSTSPFRSPAFWTVLGVALFLFIPAVLFLFVAHPAPVGASLATGAILMIGHRFLAFPYFRTLRPTTCAWCHRSFDGAHPGQPALELSAGRQRHSILACELHLDPTRRFFQFLDRHRWPLRAGIGLPLVLLVAALTAAAAGQPAWLEPATELFRLGVGLTVQVAALGPILGAPSREATAAFPVHNFYLLGIRAILWIFRLVGIWWIVSAGRYWLGV